MSARNFVKASILLHLVKPMASYEPRNALALFYLGVAAQAADNKPAALLLPADAPIRGVLEERTKAGGEVEQGAALSRSDDLVASN